MKLAIRYHDLDDNKVGLLVVDEPKPVKDITGAARLALQYVPPHRGVVYGVEVLDGFKEEKKSD